MSQEMNPPQDQRDLRPDQAPSEDDQEADTAQPTDTPFRISKMQTIAEMIVLRRQGPQGEPNPDRPEEGND